MALSVKRVALLGKLCPFALSEKSGPVGEMSGPIGENSGSPVREIVVL